jgi:hypothetical protein
MATKKKAPVKKKTSSGYSEGAKRLLMQADKNLNKPVKKDWGNSTRETNASKAGIQGAGAIGGKRVDNEYNRLEKAISSVRDSKRRK